MEVRKKARDLCEKESKSKEELQAGGAPTYQSPDIGVFPKTDVATHHEQVTHPYYKELDDKAFTERGTKTVVDHRGNSVLVTGSLYKGSLTGYGEYTDRNGHKFYAYFNDDKKHGVCRVDQTSGIRQVGCFFQGQYHGPLTFWHSNNTAENVYFERGNEVRRGGRTSADRAFYGREGEIIKAKENDWEQYCSR